MIRRAVAIAESAVSCLSLESGLPVELREGDP